MPEQTTSILDPLFGDGDTIELTREQYLDLANTVNDASALAYMMGAGRHVRGQDREVIEETLRAISDDEVRGACMYVARTLYMDRAAKAAGEQLVAELEAAAAAGDLD